MSNSFVCANCRKVVSLTAPGTHNRNHCPFCLWSFHVDLEPGDRKSLCNGLMKPVGKFIKSKGEEVLIHKCIKCGLIRCNRVAGDDDINLVEKLELV